ncbi:MAG: branched-chain amino acid ABC transporter permease [Acidimicrobiales bacterium]
MTAATAVLNRRGGGRRYRNLLVSRAQELRIVRTRWQWAGAAALLVLYLYLPQQLSDPTLLTLTYCGMYAIGTIGLNLLTGFTGQISIGHAAFFGAGAYAAYYFGAQQDWPFPAYFVVAAFVGLVLGAVIGPFALRLRGHYLAIVTIGLLFVAEHLFVNWESVTGGRTGARLGDTTVKLGPLDFNGLEVGSESYTREQSMFWLVWALVALTALLAKNIVRTRPGRAMQAVRDRDLSAEVIGVRIARYKIGAFAVSSAMAAAAGCLYLLLQRNVNPTEFGGQQGLFLSITFVAMVIIGGVGTVFGSVLGALFVWGGQRFIAENSDLGFFDALIITSPSDPNGWFSIGEFNGILFGLFIILFLLFEPRGLAAVWYRLKTYLQTWPFSQ